MKTNNLSNSRNSFDRTLRSNNSDSRRRRRHGGGMTDRGRGDDRHALQAAIERSKLLDMNKPIYFNVMLCGKTDTGKSEFLSRFLKEGFNKNVKVKRKSQKIMEYILEKKDGDLRYIMTAIDCPGHGGDKPIKEWYKSIKDYAKSKVKIKKLQSLTLFRMKLTMN